MMTTQQLIDLPGYGSATQQLITQKRWDYDYPQWFFDRIEEILKIQLNEDQRIELRDVYEEALEGY